MTIPTLSGPEGRIEGLRRRPHTCREAAEELPQKRFRSRARSSAGSGAFAECEEDPPPPHFRWCLLPGSFLLCLDALLSPLLSLSLSEERLLRVRRSVCVVGSPLSAPKYCRGARLELCRSSLCVQVRPRPSLV